MSLDFQGPVHVQFKHFGYAQLNTPVFRIFEETALRNPDKIALRCEKNQLSYLEALNQARTMARAIKAVNPHREPVGIALPNDVFFPVAMLAALAAGCPYVPLDIDLPVARNQQIIAQSELTIIISTAPQSDLYDVPTIINIGTLTPGRESLFKSDATPDDLAYIIYTSGSTGIPKGVYQNQRNLMHDIMQYTNSVHINEDDCLSLLYSPAVGGANRDIFGALLNGATLAIKNLKQTGLFDLSRFLKEEKITIYHSIPNIFRAFLKLNPAKNDFETIRLIYLAGDRIYKSDVDLYKTLFPVHCLLYVGIGATEIATIYRQWFINHQTLIAEDLIPLGHPVEDRDMLLTDDNNNPVSDGQVGEISVSSRFIALGYWKNQEQTSNSFLVSDLDPDIRTYRTGDLGRINNEGLLEFLGRKDNQTKINGYRVELSEIEGRLMSHKDVERCGVSVYTRDRHNLLYAFYMSKTAVSEVELKNWLGEKLPPYMIPHRCIQVAEIPLLHNFKNDPAALKKLVEKYTTQESNQQASVDNDFLKNTIRQAWCKFLDEQSFDSNARWQDAGGDSVNAVNLLVQLESDMGITLPTDWIHGGMNPTEIHEFLKSMNIQKKILHENIIYFFPPLLGIKENTRIFLNELAEYTTIKVLRYPKLNSIPHQNRNWDYVNKALLEQMPDYGQPHVGYLSTCNGGSSINNLISSVPPSSYSMIGLIEGNYFTYIPPVHKYVFNRLRRLFRSENKIQLIVSFLYNRSTKFKMLINYLERKNLYSHSDKSLLHHHSLTVKPTRFEGEVWYFGCDKSILNKDGLHWAPHFRKVNVVHLKGIHYDLLEPHNREVVLNKILDILGKQKT